MYCHEASPFEKFRTEKLKGVAMSSDVLELEALEKMGRVMKQSPDTEKAIVAIRKALAEHIEQHLEMVEQSTCKQALQVEQPAQGETK